MNNLNTVLPNGTFGVAVSLINANFSLIVNAINSLEYASTKSKGIHNYGFVPSTTTIPNAVSGDWCMVLREGNTFPADIWTYNGTSWSKGGAWNPEGLDLTDYAKTSDLTTAIANSLAQATARMGYCEATISNAEITAALTEYVLPVVPSSGAGNVRIKMPSKAISSGTYTLNINNTGAKTIMYNGLDVSPSNTWEANEVVVVYYANNKYWASNSQGGSADLKVKNTDADLDFTDEQDNVVMQLSEGHVKTKNFDSRDFKTFVGDENDTDLDFTDEQGNVVMRVAGGHVKTKYFDSALNSERPSAGYEVFSFAVDTTIPARKTSGAGVQDGENYKTDKGIVMFPDSYTSCGNPTRLVMFCHGLGGLVKSNSTALSQPFPLHSALLADGYAVFEINGTPGVEDATYSHFGAPIWSRSCIAAYKYLIEKYNFKTDGILTYGYSLGGMASLQLPNFSLPIIAQLTYAGVYDQFKSSYAKENATGKAAFLERFGMMDYPELTNGGVNIVPPQEERDYIIEHRDMWARYADLAYGVTTPDIARMYSVWPAPSVAYDAEEEAIYDGLVIGNRPPCMFIHGENDTTIMKRYTTFLATMIDNGGGIADVRFFSGGTHQNILTIGDNVSYTASNGQTLTLNASSYEGLLFLKRFDY